MTSIVAVGQRHRQAMWLYHVERCLIMVSTSLLQAVPLDSVIV